MFKIKKNKIFSWFLSFALVLTTISCALTGGVIDDASANVVQMHWPQELIQSTTNSFLVDDFESGGVQTVDPATWYENSGTTPSGSTRNLSIPSGAFDLGWHNNGNVNGDNAYATKWGALSYGTTMSPGLHLDMRWTGTNGNLPVNNYGYLAFRMKFTGSDANNSVQDSIGSNGEVIIRLDLSYEHGASLYNIEFATAPTTSGRNWGWVVLNLRNQFSANVTATVNRMNFGFRYANGGSNRGHLAVDDIMLCNFPGTPENMICDFEDVAPYRNEGEFFQNEAKGRVLHTSVLKYKNTKNCSAANNQRITQGSDSLNLYEGNGSGGIIDFNWFHTKNMSAYSAITIDICIVGMPANDFQINFEFCNWSNYYTSVDGGQFHNNTQNYCYNCSDYSMGWLRKSTHSMRTGWQTYTLNMDYNNCTNANIFRIWTNMDSSGDLYFDNLRGANSSATVLSNFSVNGLNKTGTGVRAINTSQYSIASPAITGATSDGNVLCLMLDQPKNVSGYNYYKTRIRRNGNSTGIVGFQPIGLMAATTAAGGQPDIDVDGSVGDMNIGSYTNDTYVNIYLPVGSRTLIYGLWLWSASGSPNYSLARIDVVKRYTITLNNQSATSAGTTSVMANYGESMPSITVPTKTGYTFGGYYTATNGGGTQYITAAGASARTSTFTANTTLYAKWTANNYYLDLNGNLDGSGASDISGFGTANVTVGGTLKSSGCSDYYIQHPYGSSYSIEVTASAGHYVYENSTVSSTYTYTGTIGTGNKTVTPILKTEYYNVTYNGNGGSSSGPVSQKYGATITASSTRTGYTLEGWYTAASGGTKVTTIGDYGNHNGSATLYAHWTVNSYSLSYTLNSGTSGGTQPGSASYNTAFTVTNPTRTGYTFNGWTISGMDGCTHYFGSATSTATSSSGRKETSYKNLRATAGTVTFSAAWSANKYTVNFDGQGATNAGTTTTQATYAAAMPSITPPTRTGYTFGGYFTSTGGGGTQYYNASGTSARNWDKTATTILYAKWTANQYTVTLNRQSGSGGSESATPTYGSAMPSIQIPTLTGFTFMGYFTSTGGAGTKYYNANGTSATNWNIASNTTLYAYWTVKSFTYNFNANGGAAVASVTKNFGQALPTTTRTGYTFGGWCTAQNAGGNNGSGDVYSTAPDVGVTGTTATLYAYWTIESYNIIFDETGGNAITDKAYAYGAALPTTTRIGFTFSGWSKTNGGASIGSNTPDLGSNGTTVTLYALWTIESYNLTFVENGGDDIANGSYQYGTNLPTTTKTGYNFQGWCVDSGCTGTAYTTVQDWGGNGASKTLYAKWTVKTNVSFTIHYYLQGASSRVRDDTIVTNQTYNTTETRNAPAVTGYTIVPGNETIAIINNAYDKEYNVYYTANIYTITMDQQGGTGGTATIYEKFNNGYYPTIECSGTKYSPSTGIAAPEREGYIFGGYYTATNGGGTQYFDQNGKLTSNARTMNFTTNGSLYAKWSVKNDVSYTVRYLRRDTGVAISEQTTGSGKTFDTTETIYPIAIIGYTPEQSSMSITHDEYNKPYIFYYTPNIYKLTLNMQSGSGGTSYIYEKYDTGYYLDQEATSQKKMTGSSNGITIPTRTGYSFGGYYTQTGGNGTQYISAEGRLVEANAGITNFTADTTLYAKWTQKVYEIEMRYYQDIPDYASHELPSGFTTIGSPHVYLKYADAYYKESGCTNKMTSSANPITIPARTGYVFGGYYSAKNGVGTCLVTVSGNISQAATNTMYNDVTSNYVYAKWTAGQYNVILDANGGTIGTANVTATYDNAMPTIQNLPTRIGYLFAGFYTTASGTGVQYYSNTGASMRNWDRAATTTLFARWTPITYTISYALNGDNINVPAYGTSHPVSATFNTAFNIDNPTRTGYTFSGWTISGMDTTIHYYGTAQNSLTNSTTGTTMSSIKATWFKNLTAVNGATVLFTANWTANDYKITLNTDGAIKEIYATYSASMPPMGAIPTKSHYLFGGYFTKTNGGGVQYYLANGTSARNWDIKADTILYVYWTAKPKPNVPTGLRPYSESVAGARDGRIAGVTTAMEYSTNGTNWTSISSAPLTGLSGGTYYIRVKETATTDNSNNATIEVYVGKYIVTWTVGATVTSAWVQRGTSPVYNGGVTPTKTASEYTYTFIGWYNASSGNFYGSSLALPAMESEDVGYTAQFNSLRNTAGTVSSSNTTVNVNVPYDQTSNNTVNITSGTTKITVNFTAQVMNSLTNASTLTIASNTIGKVIFDNTSLRRLTTNNAGKTAVLTFETGTSGGDKTYNLAFKSSDNTAIYSEANATGTATLSLPDNGVGTRFINKINADSTELFMTANDVDDERNVLEFNPTYFYNFKVKTTAESITSASVTIVGVNMTLTSDFRLNYYIDPGTIPAGCTNFFMVFTKTSRNSEGNLVTVTKKITEHIIDPSVFNYYRYTYDGLAAKEMSDNVDAVFYISTAAGQLYNSVTKEYSIRTYAKNQLTKSETSTGYRYYNNTPFRRLLVDMLNYGAAAQDYFNYNTADKANSTLTAPQVGYAGAEATPTADATADKVISQPKATITSATLSLESRVEIVYTVDPTAYLNGGAGRKISDLTLYITYTDLNDEPRKITLTNPTVNSTNSAYCDFRFSTLTSAQMQTVCTATVMAGETNLSNTKHYTIETYAANIKSDAESSPNIKTLVTKMSTFGRSVHAFVTA